MFIVMAILAFILMCYFFLLLGSTIGISQTNFLPPKGLWKLVPFRVGGWRSPNTGKVATIKWMNE